MKKLFTSLVLIAALGNVAAAQSNKNDKAAMIKSHTDKLAAQLVESGIEEEKVKKFAACFAADMDKTMNADEVNTFVTLQELNTGKTEMTEEMRHKAMQLRPKMAALGQSCNILLSK